MMKEIDAFSLAPIPLSMRFEKTELAKGTGFTWNCGGNLFLITNWHNVTGINPRTGKHLSCHAMLGATLYSVNDLPQASMMVAVGMDAFILGYPRGIGAGIFPIWKRASIASEPNV
jgi:hypothetical protein